jgi:hypothetical protein
MQPKDHDRVNKSLPVKPIVFAVNPSTSSHCFLRYTLILFSHIYPGHPNYLFRELLQIVLCVYFHQHDTRYMLRVSLILISLIRSWDSRLYTFKRTNYEGSHSLCFFVYSLATSSLMKPTVFLRPVFSGPPLK